MFSIHFTNHVGFLLLFPLGFLLLWRQYQNLGSKAENRFIKPLLLTLQSLALLLVVLSLAAPEIIRHQVEFHRPAILILRDQSESFLNGSYLGLEQNYQSFEKKILAYAKENNFEVRTVDFTEHFPVALPPNLKGVLLFSDGQLNAESSLLASNFFRKMDAPLFPVRLDSNERTEIQAEKVVLNLDGNPVEIAFNYQSMGPHPSRARFQLIKSNKILFEETFPAEAGTGEHHFNWSTDKKWLNSSERIYAVLQPELANNNFNPWNDTVEVAMVGATAKKTIFVLKPIHSLDEKAMFDILHQSEVFKLEFFEIKELNALPLTEDDQVWMEWESLGSNSQATLEKVKDWIEKAPAKMVFYAGPSFQENVLKKNSTHLSLSNLVRVDLIPNQEWKLFNVNASVSINASIGEGQLRVAHAFPDEIVKLKDMSPTAISAMNYDSSSQSLVSIKEGQSRGIVMGKFSLGSGKQFLWFSLPGIWNEIFSAQVDYPTHRRIMGFVNSVCDLAEFSLNKKAVTTPIPLVDTLSSVAKKRMELSRIGFNDRQLSEWAKKTGGQVVTSVLPALSNEEAKEDRIYPYRFYNSVPLFLLILVLLSSAWALRKKWDLD